MCTLYCIVSLNSILFLNIFHEAAIAIKISNLLICFCSFDLSCPIREKDIFIEKCVYCLVSLNIVLLNLFVLIYFFFRKWITVGGIRSTGVSACLGISSHVCDLVRDFGLDPSRGPTSHIERINWSILPGKAAIHDECVYHMTHPITKYGTTKNSML